MPNALVHIGMHKSGSSYIQTLLRKNETRFDAAGIAAMVNVKSDMQGFTQAARKAARRNEPVPRVGFPDLEARMQAVPSDRHLFLSCESLENLCPYPDALGQFDAILSRRFETVTYLLVVRNAVDFLNSRAQQRIKRFYQPDYGNLERLASSYGLDRRFAALLDCPVSVSLEDFDCIVKGDTPTEIGRLSTCHLGPQVELEDVPAANTSVGATGIAVSLCLTHMLRETLGGEIPVDWQRRGRVSGLMQEALHAAGLTTERFNAFGPERQAEIVAEVRRDGRQFLDRFEAQLAGTFLSCHGSPDTIVLISELPDDMQRRIFDVIAKTWHASAKLLRREFGIEPADDPRPLFDRFCRNERALVGPRH